MPLPTFIVLISEHRTDSLYNIINYFVRTSPDTRVGIFLPVMISFTVFGMVPAIPIFMILCNPLSVQHYRKSPISNFTRISGILCQGINSYKPLSKVRIPFTKFLHTRQLQCLFYDISSDCLVADSRSQRGEQMVRRKVECDLHIRCSFLNDAQNEILTSRPLYQVYGN